MKSEENSKKTLGLNQRKLADCNKKIKKIDEQLKELKSRQMYFKGVLDQLEQDRAALRQTKREEFSEARSTNTKARVRGEKIHNTQSYDTKIKVTEGKLKMIRTQLKESAENRKAEVTRRKELMALIRTS